MKWVVLEYKMAYQRLMFFVVSLCMTGFVLAEVVGQTYPIQEPDLIKEIERTLKEKEKTGELARLQKEAIGRSQHSAINPSPVQGVMRTRIPRSFYFDPTVVANRRIMTPDGKVIVEAGQKFNPLDQISMSRRLIFFDARDPLQIKKVEDLIKQADGRAKPILVGGSYIDIQKQWGRPVFFDQAGILVRKFGIRQVPAVVFQEDKRLRIDEIGM
jgi:conjugal transfer pilus assembly protein TraW